MSTHVERYTLDIGLAEVTLRRSSGSRTMTAGILGHTRDAAGEIVRLVLDRRIHGQRTVIEGWTASGPVTSVLEKRPEIIANS